MPAHTPGGYLRPGLITPPRGSAGSHRHCAFALLIALGLLIALCGPARAERDYLFYATDAGGVIFSVQVGDEVGVYQWHLGTAGTFRARLLGTAIRLENSGTSGWVREDAEGDLQLELGSQSYVLQQESLGYGCYETTLTHAKKNTPRRKAGVYIFRQATPNGQIWSVRLTLGAGSYHWYLGASGKATATVKGTTVKLKTRKLEAEVRLSADGDVEITRGGSLPPEILQPNSAGYGCYEATLRHHGTWQEPTANRNYIYQDTSLQGELWAVRHTGTRGRYVWYVGDLGKADAKVIGTRVTLKGATASGVVVFDARGHVVFTERGEKTTFARGSLAYGCYKATLTHHGTWPETVVAPEYLYRDTAADGMIWSVEAGATRGSYSWQMGAMGQAKATVQGTKVSVASPTLRGTVQCNSAGEVILKAGGERLILQPGSVGHGCYKATLQHYGTWSEQMQPKSWIWQNAGLDGALWAVKPTSTTGRYTWLIGAVGEATVTVRGKALTIVCAGLTATLAPDARGDLILDEAAGRTLMPVGSLMAGAYEATIAHARGSAR